MNDPNRPFPHFRRHAHTDPEWRSRRRFLFRRFARLVAATLVLFLIGMAGLAFLFTRIFDGNGQATLAVWLSGCGLAFALPLLAGFLAVRSFSWFADPVARLMAAADAVAEGDFSVRLPEKGPAEFVRLARSFNHMVEELAFSDQQRKNLTADVAHELRTPLHILQGNLEGMLDGVYEATPEQVNLLLDETHQLTRLVEDLRTLSLAETGQLTLAKEEFNLGEMISDIATSFSGQAEQAGVCIEVGIPENTTPLLYFGDPGRLDQVLSNLVANALRYTSQGGIIRLAASMNGGEAVLKVSDNGKGIPPEDLPFIFDRFWKGERSRHKQAGAGSGLGLAISRQLVQAHGGTIGVESKPGEGSTFTIKLPVKSDKS